MFAVGGDASGAGRWRERVAQDDTQLLGVLPGLVVEDLAQAHILALKCGLEALDEHVALARMGLLQPLDRGVDAVAHGLTHDRGKEMDDRAEHRVDLGGAGSGGLRWVGLGGRRLRRRAG